MAGKRVATNLTLKSVTTLQPAASPYEVRDAEVKGLILRVQPSGTKTYYFEYLSERRSESGRRLPNRVKIGSADSMEPPHAREAARRIEANHRVTGQDPVAKRKQEKEQEAKRITYLQFLDGHYEPHLRAKLRGGVNNDRNVKETMANLKNGFPEMHALGLSEITPLVIDRWHQRRKRDGVSNARIKRQLNDLSACLNRAVKWDALAVSPFEKVDAIKLDSNAKPRFLSEAEEARLRAVLDTREAAITAEWCAEQGYRGRPARPELGDNQFADYLKPAVLLSINTGLREGELIDLKWSEVDFDKNQLTVLPLGARSGAKSTETRHVQLSPEALDVLTQWKQQIDFEQKQQAVVPLKPVPWVFHNNGKPFEKLHNKSFDRVLDDAQINGFRWHDMRHTFASKLVAAGVDLNTVRELMGHGDYKMTLRYAHLAPNVKQDAVNKLVPAKIAT